MKAYPLELRQRIVDAVDHGTQTIEAIAETFNVSERYVYKLLEIRRDRNTIAPVGHRGGAKAKLNDHQIRTLATFVEKTPDATLDELRQRVLRRFNISVSINTIWRILAKLDLTVKKNHSSGRSRPGSTSGIPTAATTTAREATVVHRRVRDTSGNVSSIRPIATR